MKRLLLAAIAASLGLSGCYAADASYGVASPAGAAYYDDGSTGQVWIDGRWVWGASGWQWTPGYWVAERPGYAYVQGYWGYQDNHWLYHPGTWAVAQHGHVYVDGHWRRHAPSHPRSHHDYRGTGAHGGGSYGYGHRSMRGHAGGGAHLAAPAHHGGHRGSHGGGHRGSHGRGHRGGHR